MSKLCRILALALLAAGTALTCSCHSAAGLARAAYRTAESAPSSLYQSASRFARNAPSSIQSTASRTMGTVNRTISYQSN